MSLKSELQAIINRCEQEDRATQAKEVVEHARDRRRNPQLWKRLWGPSDRELAEAQRLQIAHQLIIQITIKVLPASKPHRMMLHIKSSPGYRHVNHVRSKIDLSELYLRAIYDDIIRLREKVITFKGIIDEAKLKRIDAILKRAQQATKVETQQRASNWAGTQPHLE